MPIESVVGKKVGGALYIHMDAVNWAPEKVLDTLKRALDIAKLDPDAFNVVKYQSDDRMSLLQYEDFDVSPFPALILAHTIDLTSRSVKTINHSKSGNPPILHRKELLLAADDSRRGKFLKLTHELEKRGLFENSREIGRKKSWIRRLKEANARIENHTVSFEEELEQGPHVSVSTPSEVARHKTAISRSRLSAPMQALARAGFLSEELTVLDYGCGQGDDVSILQMAGLNVSGWDPHFRPDERIEAADVVNLGYVVNVIEEPAERLQAIERAFSFATKVLCVAVMVWGKGNTEGQQTFRDGFLTNRGTFQKYFSQEEIRGLVEHATGKQAIMVGPGILFIFADEIAEQEYLLERQSRATDISDLLAHTSLRLPAEVVSRDDRIIEAHTETILKIWQKAGTLGRIPDPAELGGKLFDEVKANLGSLRTAIRLGAQLMGGVASIEDAAKQRKDDLSVYFALNLFGRRKVYRELPLSLQRDVKTFFGSQRNAKDAGKAVLFSTGSVDKIRDACIEASNQRLGYLDDNHSLQIVASGVSRLPSVLRAYVGCAEVLYGDISVCDIVKIHIGSGKLTLLFCEKFETPLPKVLERVKISMREQEIEFFSYGSDYPKSYIYLKSRFMCRDDPGIDAQMKFDDRLQKLTGFDFTGHGPSSAEFASKLRRLNLGSVDAASK